MINKLQLVILGVVIVYGGQSNAMLNSSCGAEAKKDGAKLKALAEKKHKQEPPLYYDSPCGSDRIEGVYHGNEGRFYTPNQSGCTHGCP